MPPCVTTYALTMAAVTRCTGDDLITVDSYN